MITHLIDTRLTYDVYGDSHFCLLLAAQRDDRQRILDERLTVRMADGRVLTPHEYQDPRGNRHHRFSAPAGHVMLDYHAEVQRDPEPDRSLAVEQRIEELPDDALPWLLPTRLCEADLLSQFAVSTFGNGPSGYARVEAVMDWVRQNVEYRVGTSNPTTSAFSVFNDRVGVCRDYAHICIAVCRALNLPARLLAGYSLFEEPPQDFHAMIEVWLGRWFAFDPTGLADPNDIVRIAYGVDAKETAFGTLYGPVAMRGMEVDVAHRDEATGVVRIGDNSTHVMPIVPMQPVAAPAGAQA